MNRYLIFSHEYPPFQGGIGNYAHGVANALHRAGIRVLVVTTSIADEMQGCNDSEAPRILIKSTQKPGLIRLLYYVYQYFLILKKYPDAQLHSMDWQSWKIFSILNLLMVYSYSITFHGSEILSARHSFRTRIFGIRMLFRGTYQLSVNSQYTLERLIANFPFCCENRIRIAYPSPQECIVRDASSHLAFATSNPKKFRILTVARIEPRKGHLIALSTLREIVEKDNIHIEWNIVGEPIDKDYLQQLLNEASLAPLEIEYHGKLPAISLADQYKKADLFLLTGSPHPTKCEGFGMVYIEAGLFHLPSVGIATGGVPEAVLDEKTGLLSSPDDPNALKQNLMRLIKDADLRIELGEQAYHFARTFTWNKTAKAIFPELETHLNE